MPTYDAYSHPIQRVDALKYFLLWHYGGVYMGLDISCRRSLDPLLAFPAWFPRGSPLGINNDLMATAARHSIMKMMTENLKSRNKWLVFPYLTVFWSTGPKFASDMVMAWFSENIRGGVIKRAAKKTDAGMLSERRTVLLDTNGGLDPNEVYVLPQIFYSEQYTFFGHRPGGTWHGKDVFVVLWFVDRPGVFLLLVCTVLSIVVVVAKRRSIPGKSSHLPRFLFSRSKRSSMSLPLFRSRPWTESRI
jgi:inositol phosphorylceramide mannosyltransferase catalytic subunit